MGNKEGGGQGGLRKGIRESQLGPLSKGDEREGPDFFGEGRKKRESNRGGHGTREWEGKKHYQKTGSCKPKIHFDQS